MKMLIKYYEIKSDHILASPQYDREEIVEVSSPSKLDTYIATKKDAYGHKYKREKFMGFTHLSRAGALKVTPYQEPKIKKIK